MKRRDLLQNFPVAADGTIDSDEREIVKGVGAWMKVNSECIYDTRPWSVCGEGLPRTIASVFKIGGDMYI